MARYRTRARHRRRNPTYTLIKDPDKYNYAKKGARTAWLERGGKHNQYVLTLNSTDRARIKALYVERKTILRRMDDLDRTWRRNTQLLNELGEHVYDEGT